MSFSYNVDELDDSLLFQVRLISGQTSPDSILTISDEEINYFLRLSQNNVTQAALDVLNSLIARGHELVDKQTGQVSESQSQILENLLRIRDDLINSLARSTPDFVQFTGVFADDIEEVQLDLEIFHDGAERINQGPSYYAQG